MINVLLIGNTQLKEYFSNEFNVFTINDDFFYLKDFCKKNRIDAIVQVENLSKREFFADISQIPCLKIFWAIDIHLNFYWQKDYFQNFDIILTSQLNFVKKINKKAIWLPWGIEDKFISEKFIPLKERKFKISFVGLIDENRIKRKNIIEILKREFDIYIAGDTLKNRLPIEKVLEIYKNSWIVINESINRDINFRYFEATSQGALLYTEKISNGENILFLENYEFILYSQKDLIKKLKELINFPEKIEKIAYRGYIKTLNFHKLSDRVKAIENIIKKNLKNFKVYKSNVSLPILKTTLRGICDKKYIKRFFEINDDEKLNLLLLKTTNPQKFLNSAIKLTNEPLIEINLIPLLFENSSENPEEIIKKILKIYKKNSRLLPDYFVGYENMANQKIFFTNFEFLFYFYNKFKSISQKNKNLNLVLAKILMENENYASALHFVLNLHREYPQYKYFLKLLEECLYKIYALDFLR